MATAASSIAPAVVTPSTIWANDRSIPNQPNILKPVISLPCVTSSFIHASRATNGHFCTRTSTGACYSNLATCVPSKDWTTQPPYVSLFDAINNNDKDMSAYVSRIHNALIAVRNEITSLPPSELRFAMAHLSQYWHGCATSYPTVPIIFLPLLLRGGPGPGDGSLMDAADLTHIMLSTGAASDIASDQYPSLWYVYMTRILQAQLLSKANQLASGRAAPLPSTRWNLDFNLAAPSTLLQSLMIGNSHLPFDQPCYSIPMKTSPAVRAAPYQARPSPSVDTIWKPPINPSHSILQFVLDHYDIPDHVANTLCQLGADPNQIDQPDNARPSLTDDDIKWRLSLDKGASICVRSDTWQWSQATVVARRTLPRSAAASVRATPSAISSTGVGDDDGIPVAPPIEANRELIAGSYEMASPTWRAANPWYDRQSHITQIAVDMGYMLYMDAMSPRIAREEPPSLPTHADLSPVIPLYGRTPMERALAMMEPISGVPFSKRRPHLVQAMIDGHNAWKLRQHRWLHTVMDITHMVMPVALITFGYCGSLIPFP